MEEVKNAKRNLYHFTLSAAIKEEKHTTNVIIAFDGSAGKNDHISLNNWLLEGTALQQDIAAPQILLTLTYTGVGQIWSPHLP